jgi:methylglyoxal synthase
MPVRKLEARKRIALIAHDHKKPDLVEWAIYNKDALRKHQLSATGTTGILCGPLGGDQQIGAAIAEGKIDVIIFFWDPMEALPHDPDIKALLRLAVAWNILVACDRATADFILTSPLMFQEYETIVPDYTKYLGRKV